MLHSKNNNNSGPEVLKSVNTVVELTYTLDSDKIYCSDAERESDKIRLKSISAFDNCRNIEDLLGLKMPNKKMFGNFREFSKISQFPFEYTGKNGNYDQIPRNSQTKSLLDIFNPNFKAQPEAAMEAGIVLRI